MIELQVRSDKWKRWNETAKHPANGGR